MASSRFFTPSSTPTILGASSKMHVAVQRDVSVTPYFASAVTTISMPRPEG
jgi:hypothetical protein